MPATAQIARAQILVEDPSQHKKIEVGERAARRYFVTRDAARRAADDDSGGGGGGLRSPAASGERYMSVHVGTFLNDKQYRWGSRDHNDDVGQLVTGVTYRVGEWVNSMDLLFRGELITYEIDGEHPTKLSLMPMIAFPDAKSDFPLYFGAGAGLGLFFNQVDEESDLSLDYQIVAGLRFPELFDTMGLIFETGWKGHIHLLSSGQFDGVFLTTGLVFEF